MAVEHFDPREIEDNPYQHLATYNPDQVAQFFRLFKEDADAGRAFPAAGHPLPTGRRTPLGKVQLADGHHRRDAFLRLLENGDTRFERFPIDIKILTDDDMIAAVGETAMNRKATKPLDQARYFKALTDRGWTQARISSRFAVSQPMVSKYIAVLELPEGVLMWLDKAPVKGEFTISHAYELLDLNRLAPDTLDGFVKEKGKGLIYREWGNPQISDRSEVANAADSAVLSQYRIVTGGHYEPFPPDWSPKNREGIKGDAEGRCDGCAHLIKYRKMQLCGQDDCFALKRKRIDAEKMAEQHQKMLDWAATNGFPPDKITQESYNSYHQKVLDPLEPCSAAECACLRVARDDNGWNDMGRVVTGEPYRYFCIEPDNRLEKARAVGRIEAKPGYSVDTPEAREKRARQERLDALCEELIRAYVGRLELAPLAAAHEVDIFARALGLKPKAKPADTYRHAAEHSLRVIAKPSWNAYNNPSSLDAPKLIDTLVGVEAKAHVRVVNKISYIRLSPDTKAKCELCDTPRADPIFGGLRSASDGEPVEPRYVCGHHLVYLEITGEDEEEAAETKSIVAPEGYTLLYASKGGVTAHLNNGKGTYTVCGEVIKNYLLTEPKADVEYKLCEKCRQNAALAGNPNPQPEPQDTPAEATPVTSSGLPDDHVLRYSHNPDDKFNLSHFFDVTNGWTFCGRVHNLEDVPRAGLEYKPCSVCAAPLRDNSCATPAPAAEVKPFVPPTVPDGFQLFYVPGGTRYHFAYAGDKIQKTLCGREINRLATAPVAGNDYRPCAFCNTISLNESKAPAKL